MVGATNLYWGELHTHTAYSDGQSTPEEAVAEAKNHLNFWACADHICSAAGIESWHTRFVENWPETQRVIAENNHPGRFVTILAYEYTSIGGDFNIYFPGDSAEAFLPEDVQEFAEFARETNAILIPHHTGYIPGVRGLDWSTNYIEDVMPLVEVFSMHGSSECEPGPFPMNLPWMGPRATYGTVRKGLNRGHRFGLMASSDGHGGYPGNYLMGLTAVHAPELTREAIFDALRNRRCHAVTGDRIELKFGAEGEWMGGEIDPGDIELTYFVEAKDAIDRIEIVKNNHVYHTAGADGDRTKTWQVRLEWGWGKEQGAVPWDGGLRVVGGELLTVSPNFGSPGPNRIVSKDDSSCEWETHVNIGLSDDWRHCRNGREATQQIVFTVRGDSDMRLDVCTRGYEMSAEIDRLQKASQAVICADDAFGPKFKFHQARGLDECVALNTFEDRACSGDYYYLRAIQANGQMAWSSPIFVR